MKRIRESDQPFVGGNSALFCYNKGENPWKTESEEKNMQTLGERITYYRKKNGMTQEQLAEKCSVTPQAVSKWENDLTAPDISLFPRLAELFSVSTDELLGVRKKPGIACRRPPAACSCRSLHGLHR